MPLPSLSFIAEHVIWHRISYWNNIFFFCPSKEQEKVWKIYYWLKWKQAYSYGQAQLQAWKFQGIRVHNTWTATVLWQNNYLLFLLKSSRWLGQVVQKCICNTTEANFFFFLILIALWFSLWCSLRGHELDDFSVTGSQMHAPEACNELKWLQSIWSMGSEEN